MIQAKRITLKYKSGSILGWTNATFTLCGGALDILSSDDGPFSESLLNLATVEFDLA